MISVTKVIGSKGRKYTIEVEGNAKQRWSFNEREHVKKKLEDLKCKEIVDIFKELDDPRGME